MGSIGIFCLLLCKFENVRNTKFYKMKEGEKHFFFHSEAKSIGDKHCTGLNMSPKIMSTQNL